MSDVSFNIKSFIKGSDEYKEKDIVVPVDVVETAPSTKKTRKKKEETNIIKATTAPLVPQSSMTYIQENIPYDVAYNTTTEQLDEAINQLNYLSSEVMKEFQNVKNSKTLKNKYNYINDLANTTGSIISSKIMAIKEKNKTINDISKLEIARLKELKVRQNEEDENQQVAKMYDAFINMPMGVGVTGLAPSMQDMIMPGGNMTMMSNGMDDMAQAAWEANLSPAENRMVLDAKGIIDTVVVYDAATGNRFFDVIDKNTGQSVPNVEKPDDSYIYDLDINIRGGYAKDSNINVKYPLIVLNANDMSDY